MFFRSFHKKAFKTKLVFWGTLITLLTAFPLFAIAEPFSREDLLRATPSEGEVTLGDPNSPVLAIEYASLTCIHCANYHAEVFPTIKRDYVDTKKIRYVYRHYPLDNLAFAAAMLVSCTPQETRFPLIETLMETQQTWTRSDSTGPALLKIARQAGVTREKFEACLKDQKTYAAIQETRNHAQKAFNVNATPTLIINGNTFKGLNLKKIRAALDVALEKNAGATP